MCIFIKHTKEVRQTRILVSPTRNNRALIVYENYVGIDKGNRTNAVEMKKIAELKAKQEDELNSPNAMILPAPLSSEDNDIELLDLSGGMIPILAQWNPSFKLDSRCRKIRF
jgi:hypothetical protein